MRSTREYLVELEQLSAAPSGARRSALLRRVTDLFFLTADRQTDSDRAVFGQVMTVLADQVDAPARSELALRISATPAPPAQLIRHLAHDEIDVARPLLERSQGLSDDELAEVIRAYGPEYGEAIVRRARLGPYTAEAIAARGDEALLVRLVRHHAVELSRSSFERLAKRAGTSPALREALVARGDFPDELRARLHTPGAEPVQDAPETRADETMLAQAARAGQNARAVYCFSVLTGLTQDEARSCLLETEIPALVVLCKAHRFASATFSALLQLRLAAGSLSPNGMASAMRRYETMPPDLAQRIVRFLHIPPARTG